MSKLCLCDWILCFGFLGTNIFLGFLFFLGVCESSEAWKSLRKEIGGHHE